MRRLIGKFLCWVLKDQSLTIGDVIVMHPNSLKADNIVEKSTNAGVEVSRLRPNSGTEAPDQFSANPIVGQLWYATDTYKIYIFLGIGQPGCNAKGWFNLKSAQYSA